MNTRGILGEDFVTADKNLLVEWVKSEKQKRE